MKTSFIVAVVNPVSMSDPFSYST